MQPTGYDALTKRKLSRLDVLRFSLKKDVLCSTFARLRNVVIITSDSIFPFTLLQSRRPRTSRVWHKLEVAERLQLDCSCFIFKKDKEKRKRDVAAGIYPSLGRKRKYINGGWSRKTDLERTSPCISVGV